MLIDQLRWEYRHRFAVKREYVWALKYDPQQPRDARGQFASRGTATVVTLEQCEPGEPGQCFANVNRWNTKHGTDTDRVVHGKVTNAEGKTFDHAWIERENGTVVDPTTGVILSKDKYYALLNAQPEASYTSTEAVINQMRARHHGPWTAADLALKFDPRQHRDSKGRWMRSGGIKIVPTLRYYNITRGGFTRAAMEAWKQHPEHKRQVEQAQALWERKFGKKYRQKYGKKRKAAIDCTYAGVLKFDPSQPRGKGGRWVKVGERVAEFKAKYPEAAKQYPRSTHTEMGSIESHTKDVGREWEKQLSTEELAGISERFGSDVQKLMASAIALHDIGKAEAIEEGEGKEHQHEHTIPILQKVLREEGFSEQDVSLATELLNHDLIGLLFRRGGDDTEVAAKLEKKAQKVGMNVADFATLQLAFYQADASAYPYITQSMTQESSGKWTFKGRKQIAAIEALAKKREYVREPAGSSEGGQFAKTGTTTPLDPRNLALMLNLHEVSKDGQRELGVRSEIEKVIATGSKWTQDTPGVLAVQRGIQAGMEEMLEKYPEMKDRIFVGYMNSDAFGQALTASSFRRSPNSIMLFDTSKTPEEILKLAQEAEDNPEIPASISAHLAISDPSLSKEQAIEILYKGIAIHEFGHALEAFKARQNLDGPIGHREKPSELLGRAIHELAIAEGHGSGKIEDAEWRAEWVKKNLSLYAWTGGPAEAWAEAFTAHHFGRLPAGLLKVVTGQTQLKRAMEMPADLQAWMKRRPKDYLDFSDSPVIAQKYDPDQPRGPKGTAEGGRWVKGTSGKEHWVGPGEPTKPPRTFTSDEGYEWHEQGPGRTWAVGMDPEDHAALNSYVGFGYRQVNELRRGIQPTREAKIRGLTPEEIKAVSAARQDENVKEDPIPPEGPAFRYSWAYEHARDVPSGPEKLAAHWAVIGPKVDPERLADVSKQADQLDEMIAKRGLVLEEDIVVERGAYLPGVSVDDLANLELYPDDHVWEEKAFTSTFLGDAGGRARSYPALGKWESLHQRYGSGKVMEHQDEVGTAVRFYITLPKGTKVASAEAARRIDMIYPRIQDPSVFEHPEWTADGRTKPEDYTIPDLTQKPTPRTRDLDNKDQRSESEILLASGARFRVTKVKKGYTYQSGDPTLKPVEVFEVHMEYIGGGGSEGRIH